MDDSQPENESSKETEKILISIANPDTIEDMVNLSLVIRDPKLKDNLLALNVINDDNNSDNLRIRSKHYLEKAEMTAPQEKHHRFILWSTCRTLIERIKL